VVDLGSGSGMDLSVAASRVGPAGRLIGVDFTRSGFAGRVGPPPVAAIASAAVATPAMTTPATGQERSSRSATQIAHCLLR
jgi:hypothetical protein